MRRFRLRVVLRLSGFPLGTHGCETPAGLAVVFFQRLIDSISTDFHISGSLIFLVIYGGLEITDELLSYLSN